MARSVRLQKKLHTRHLMEAAEGVVLDDSLVGKLWVLNQGDRFELNSASLSSAVVHNAPCTLLPSSI
jgi:hypothetical protein